MSLKKIEHKAPKGHVMTLGEMAAFVQDAMRSGANGSEPVEVSASWGSKIQRLGVEVEIQAVRVETPEL
jgi:hypothetical protein